MSTNTTTQWTCSVDTISGTPIASLAVAVGGGLASGFELKGLCYSPCPLNGSNANGPNLGDWFWDSFSGTGYNITGWGALWARDLPNIRALGANTVRVYSVLSRQLNSDGSYPNPWNSGTLMTHQSFLDQCWNGGVNPLYVLIGIPLPQAMFWQGIYQNTPAEEIAFWTNVLSETVGQVAAHPAVLGFIIQNELDSNVVTYGTNTDYVNFWWGQVQSMANIAKTALGTNQKLVGMAVHDDPNIAGQAASHMATCTAIDFWGVNTYQTVNFNAVFGAVPNIGPGYAGLTGPALKPVILTEWGMPATSRSTPSKPATIYADTATIGNAAAVISTVAPLAYSQQLCLGMAYFEYSDEWWNQGGAPNIYTWWGGTSAPGFPNGYWDQDGFGLYAIERGNGLNNSSPIWVQTGGNGGPNTPIDVMTPRIGTIAALTKVFNTLFTVQSNVAWQATGVAIAAATSVTITFQCGLWTANPATGMVGANGNANYIAKPKYTMPGQAEGALIGRIGTSGVAFLVGDGPTVVPAGQSGELYLCINDDLTGFYGSGLADNTGSVAVQIKVG